MSETFPSRNVLPFQRPDPVSEARNRKLFESLVTALQQPVQDLCGQVFQTGDDALFDRSERAGSSNLQNMHFETMRRLRLAKIDLSARAFEFVQAELARLLGTRNERYGRVAEAVQFDSMSLVDPDTIESEVAANASANRVRNRYVQDFQALNKRFSTVQVTPTDGEGINGFGPELFCLGFLNALTHFDCSLETRLVLLKLFERELLTACEGLLMRTHAALNACQVATEIPYRAFQRPAGPAGGAGSGGAGVGIAASGASGSAGPMTHAGPVMPHAAFAADQVVMQSLRELINALGLRYAAQNRAGPTNDAPVASPQDLAHAIQGLRLDLAAPSPHQQRTDALSAAIAEALSRQHDGNRVQIRPLDAGVIDLIGMMFDYTVSDRNIPANLQVVLAHLQIPYLKLALADPQFLARREHPARLLLNELAQAALGWTEASDRGLKALIELVVQDLLSNPDHSVEHFNRLRKELTEFCNRDGQRVQLAERKAAQAADGRNRMDIAKRDTEETLRSRLGQSEVPLPMARLIEQHWQPYLVLTHVRHGRNSQEWLDAIRLIELLAHFPRADANPENVSPWRQQFTEMESLLRNGLKQTGVADGDCDQVIAGLRELVTIERGTSVADVVLNKPGAQRVRFDAVHEPKVPPTAPAEDANVFSASDLVDLAPWVDQVRAFKAGQWFEMPKPDGKPQQVKLLWISGDHQQFMFVNGNGIKAAERKLADLAMDLRAQTLRPLDVQPLVERALAAAMQRVRGRRGG